MDKQIIINQYLFAQAGVELFFTTVNFYKQNFIELYQESDDRRGVNIDMCVYQKLKYLPKKNFARFYSDTRCVGIAGDSAKQMQSQIGDTLNYLIRKFNYIFDKHYIWLSF
jgi:hypothetical protein